jgi:hypothetical protein
MGMFKFLETLRRQDRTQGGERRDGSVRIGADVGALERAMQLRAQDRKAVDAARERLSNAYQQYLGQLNQMYKVKNAEQRQRIEAHYAVWAAFFELLKHNFQDLWAFLGVVEADVEGWFRIAPTGSDLGFMAIGREGYSFAAGIEQNSKRGAPFPKKWLTVSLAYTTSYSSGIGDERMVGREGSMTAELVGLNRCTGKDADRQEEGAHGLLERTTQFPLVFSLCSETHPKHTTQVPVSILEKYTLTELCQPLLVALTHDDVEAMKKALPSAERLLLK